MRKQETYSVDEISGKIFEKKVFLRILPYLRPYLWLFTACMFLVFFVAAISLYTPKLLGRFVDEALLPKNQTLLVIFCLLYVFLEIFRLISMLAQSYFLQRIGQNVMHGIRTDLFGKLLRMPIAFFDHNPTGKLVTRTTNDIANLAELFSAGFVMLLSDIILIAGVIIAVFFLHWKLALISLSVFPLMIFTMIFFSGRLRLAFRKSRKLLAELNSFFAERMAGMPIVQLMGREEYERNYYQNISTEYCKRQFVGVYIYSLFHPAITILSSASIVLVILFGPKYIISSEIPLGTLVAFLAYIQILYQPVRNITDKYNIFLAAMSSAERIFALLDMEEENGLSEEKRLTAHKHDTQIQGALEFKQVSFSYESSGENEKDKKIIPALKDISFSIQAGEKIAVIGHTGAGKSTLLSLLFRFYEPQEGSIILDGKNLKSYSKQELRERIGFVQQDVFLFTGTIKENLILLRKGITDEELQSAISLTGFDRIVKKLPQRLETILEERGANLSLGERQILAFTRVLLQKPDILVLDEATSNIDHESELRIQRATDKLVEGRTSLIIAHRLSTVRNADRIFVFENGFLKEAGSHNELMREQKLYARMVQA